MISLIHPHNQEKVEETKGVIRRGNSQKDRQCNVQIKNTKGQATIYKTLHRKLINRATQIPLNTGVELICFGEVRSFCFTSEIRL